MTNERPPARREQRSYGYTGRPLPQRHPYRSPYARQLDQTGPAAGARFAGVLLALAVAVLVALHGLWQVTAPAAAERVLGTVLPSLTDLDQTLTAGTETMRELALGQPPDGRVPVPGLPVRVEVPREDALNADPSRLRAIVLHRMVETLYQQGAGAFRAEDARAPSPSIFSSQWALQRTLNFLTTARHDSLDTQRLVVALAALVLVALTIWLHEGPSRLVGPGVSIVVGSLLAGGGALVAWLGTRLVFGGDNAVDDIVRIVVRDSAFTIAVVCATFAGFGIAILVMGLIIGRADQAAGDGGDPRTPAWPEKGAS